MLRLRTTKNDDNHFIYVLYAKYDEDYESMDDRVTPSSTFELIFVDDVLHGHRNDQFCPQMHHNLNEWGF